MSYLLGLVSSHCLMQQQLEQLATLSMMGLMLTQVRLARQLRFALVGLLLELVAVLAVELVLVVELLVVGLVRRPLVLVLVRLIWLHFQIQLRLVALFNEIKESNLNYFQILDVVKIRLVFRD